VSSKDGLMLLAETSRALLQPPQSMVSESPVAADVLPAVDSAGSKKRALAMAFQQHQNPSADELQGLAQRTGMNVQELEAWFSKRRILEEWVRGAGTNVTAIDIAQVIKARQLQDDSPLLGAQRALYATAGGTPCPPVTEPAPAPVKRLRHDRKCKSKAVPLPSEGVPLPRPDRQACQRAKGCITSKGNHTHTYTAMSFQLATAEKHTLPPHKRFTKGQ